MAATHACRAAFRPRTTPLSISRSSTSSWRDFDFKSLQSPGAGLVLRHTGSSSEASRASWSQSARRPVLRRASDKPSSPMTQEPMTPLSVVDKDGKIDGVIQVERAESPQPTWGRIYALGGGDVGFLLLFAAIGRFGHGFPILDWETVRAADPFIAGWFVGSYFTGGYGPKGQGLKGLKMASLAAVKSWAVGVPLALAIRGFSIGHVPPTPFIMVSLASTFVLQVGWRTAFTAIFPNDDNSFQKKKGDRQGSVFEFFELLTSLVKRW